MKTSSSIIVAVFFCVLFANFVDAFQLQNEYVITPDDNSSDQLCANCLTLTQFALNTSYYLRENTTLSLQPGNHTLQSSLVVSNIDTFTMHHIGHLRSSIQCNGNSEFMFESIEDVIISNLNLTKCFNTRVVHVTNFILSNSSFHGSFLVTSGTGLELTNTNAFLVNCFFTKFYYGNYRSVLTFSFNFSIYNNYVKRNIAKKWIGGAMIITQSNVTIVHSNFTENRAQLGGAIYAENRSTINIYETIFNFNHAHSSFFDPNTIAAGGALYAAHNCVVSIYDSYFTRNQVYFGYRIGGALTIYRSLMVIERCTSTDNRAGFGGYALLLESDVAIKMSTFNSSYAEDNGGVLFVLNSVVNLLSSNATGNGAHISGGVIYLDKSQIKIQNCNFSNNFASLRGGVMLAKEASKMIQIQDCYFVMNQAGDDGGVLYLSRHNSNNNITLQINQSRFSNNLAGRTGGVLYSEANNCCGRQ